MTLRNRVECQLRQPCELHTAREAAHCIGRHSVKTPEAISFETGIPLKRFMRITAPQAESKAMPEEIAAITKSTGRAEWMRFWVRDAGFDLFPLPIALGSDQESSEVLALSAQSVTELAEALKAFSDAWQDKQIQQDEIERYAQQKRDVFAVLERVEAWMRHRAEQRERRISIAIGAGR